MPAVSIPLALFAARSMGSENRAEMRQAFSDAIKLAEHDRLTVRVPRQTQPAQNRRGMHYHYRPEIFLGLRGTTDFTFPQESFSLGPGELAIVPAGVPHAELVRCVPDGPFRNLVVGFYNNTLSVHLAHETRPGRPDIEVIDFFDAPNLDVFLTLATTAAQINTLAGPAREVVQKGLLLALLGLFRNIVETGTGQLHSDIGKVFQAKCLVREQYADPEFAVHHIAKTLGCSADYLSHLFHRETRERLMHYLQRIRIEAAVVGLETTTLTISEIAYASGFADPAYFTRVFKQHKGVTPHEHRQQLAAHRSLAEGQPKTVYFDHVDYTPGTPQPAAAAKASRPPMKPA